MSHSLSDTSSDQHLMRGALPEQLSKLSRFKHAFIGKKNHAKEWMHDVADYVSYKAQKIARHFARKPKISAPIAGVAHGWYLDGDEWIEVIEEFPRTDHHQGSSRP